MPAWSQQNPHTFFLAESDERFHVALVGIELELALARLVEVPHNVDGYGVHPHSLRHLNSMAPVFPRNARGMHLAATNLVRLPVEQERYTVIAERE
jgi:hypothetical protein